MKKQILLIVIALLIAFVSQVNAQTFTNYTAANSDLPSDYICGGVAVDNNNNVWVGTDAGVAKFDGSSTWTIYTTTDGLPSDIISCVGVDANNNVWIGTEGDGVAKFNGSTWTKYTFADGLCDNGIYYIAGAPNGDVWFASSNAGVSKLSGTTWTTYTEADGLPTDEGFIAAVKYITFNAGGYPWCGTYKGAAVFNGTSFTNYDPITYPLLTSSVTSIAVDANDNRWIGVEEYGFLKMNSSNVWVAYYDTNAVGLDHEGVKDLKFDSNQNLWAGIQKKYGSLIVGGITKYNGTDWVSYDTTDGLVSPEVYRIDIDNNDNIWIATGGGLSKFADNVGIEENASDASLKIYPNPVNDYLNIDGIYSGTAEISDLTGRMVLSQTISSPVKINTEKLVDGIYFIKLSADNKIYNGKFIKK